MPILVVKASPRVPRILNTALQETLCRVGEHVHAAPHPHAERPRGGRWGPLVHFLGLHASCWALQSRAGPGLPWPLSCALGTLFPFTSQTPRLWPRASWSDAQWELHRCTQRVDEWATNQAFTSQLQIRPSKHGLVSPGLSAITSPLPPARGASLCHPGVAGDPGTGGWFQHSALFCSIPEAAAAQFCGPLSSWDDSPPAAVTPPPAVSTHPWAPTVPPSALPARGARAAACVLVALVSLSTV